MGDRFMSVLGQSVEGGALPMTHTLGGIEGEMLIPIVAIAGGLMVAIVAIVFGTVTSVAKRKAFEESRREIAAYVAEGTMSPKDAEQILKTGKNIG